MFGEYMLGKHAFGRGNKTKEVLENIKIFDTSLVIK